MSLNTLFRVLLSGIKFLGKHPCLRCLIEKDQIDELGTKVDIKRRKQLARKDDNHRKRLVKRAQHKIYVKGVPVNSMVISNILGEGSLTPTQVSNLYWIFSKPPSHLIAEHILSTPWSTRGQLPLSFCCRSPARFCIGCLASNFHPY